MENVCPTTSKGRDPNREDVADAFEDGIAEYYKTRWKPSNEQIIALRWVLNNIPYNKHKEEISGLLDQIKEL